MTDIKPTPQRGEALREAANIVRGMLTSGHYKPDQIPQFLDDLAAANDMLVTHAGTIN